MRCFFHSGFGSDAVVDLGLLDPEQTGLGPHAKLPSLSGGHPAVAGVMSSEATDHPEGRSFSSVRWRFVGVSCSRSILVSKVRCTRGSQAGSISCCSE